MGLLFTFSIELINDTMFYFEESQPRPSIFCPTAGDQGRVMGKGTGSPKSIDAGRPGMTFPVGAKGHRIAIEPVTLSSSLFPAGKPGPRAGVLLVAIVEAAAKTLLLLLCLVVLM